MLTTPLQRCTLEGGNPQNRTKKADLVPLPFPGRLQPGISPGTPGPWLVFVRYEANSLGPRLPVSDTLLRDLEKSSKE